MPRTVDEGFREFITRLTPSLIESAAAKSHRASIEARLKNDFRLLRFFRTGSFGNGTSISGYSDVDYFASLPNDQLTRSSDYTLTKVRNALDLRFPYTGVRVNSPAVPPYGARLPKSSRPNMSVRRMATTTSTTFLTAPTAGCVPVRTHTTHTCCSSING
jgi:hypothetical protein